MEKRHPMRVPVHLEAVLISRGNDYSGLIRNISENGAYVETAPTDTLEGFIPGTILELRFQLPSEETLSLQCEVTWLYSRKTLPDGLINSMGLEIKSPPPEFEEFIKTLFFPLFE